MANIKSAKKRSRKTIRQTMVNKNIKNRMRTYIRKAVEALKGDKESAKNAFITAESEIMKGVGKGVIHKNTAARTVSRLFAKVKALA